MTFSSAGGPWMAATVVSHHGVVVVSESWAVYVPAEGTTCFVWLLGEQALVLLGSCGFARLDVSCLPGRLPAVSWTALPWADTEASFPIRFNLCMAAAPEGEYMWAAEEVKDKLLLTAHSTSDLSCTWSGAVGAQQCPISERAWPISLQASHMAVAICCRSRSRLWTLVYSRLGSDALALGAPLFAADGLDMVSFSADGRWLVGRHGELFNHTVCVMDARTGAAAVSMQPGASYCSGKTGANVAAVEWSSWDPSQLRIKTILAESNDLGADKVLFCVLQW